MSAEQEITNELDSTWDGFQVPVAGVSFPAHGTVEQRLTYAEHAITRLYAALVEAGRQIDKLAAERR